VLPRFDSAFGSRQQNATAEFDVCVRVFFGTSNQGVVLVPGGGISAKRGELERAVIPPILTTRHAVDWECR
jgi:hypothetical protein